MTTFSPGSDPDAAPVAPSPARSEFGVDHYAYQAGQRMLVGITRTIRPLEGETIGAFRQRIHALVAALERFTTTSIEVHEEIRAGMIAQATISVAYPPRPVTIQPDPHPAGGRPNGMRGQRGARGHR